MIRPGEIYRADDDTAGPHPVVVVSREGLNRGQYVVGVMVSSAKLDRRVGLPNCVVLRAGEFGLRVDCVARAETLAPYALADLDLVGGPIGVLDAERMRDLIRAIGDVVGSDCEPR